MSSAETSRLPKDAARRTQLFSVIAAVLVTVLLSFVSASLLQQPGRLNLPAHIGPAFRDSTSKLWLRGMGSNDRPYQGRPPLLAVYGQQDGWAGYVSSEYFHLFRTLRETYGWAVAPYNSPTPRSWEAFGAGVVAGLDGKVPTVLLLMEAYDMLGNLSGSKSASKLADTEVWFFMDDLHWLSDTQHATKAEAVGAADVLLGSYMYAVPQFYPTVGAKRRLWLPHAATPVFQLPMRPWGEVAHKVFLSGSVVLPWYPYRALVAEKIANGDTRFEQLKHPGYGGNYAADAVGAGFASRLNSYLACITDGSKLNYTVAKLFEIPAAGCLLLANSEMSPLLSELGFVPNVHYVPYTAGSIDGVVDDVPSLASAAAVDRIRREGQALVWAQHTTVQRAATIHALALTGGEQEWRG